MAKKERELAVCEGTYFPAYDVREGSHDHRPRSAVRYIVLHSTEGWTAAGAASWFKNPAAGSTQLVVDDTVCYRTANDDDVVAGAAGGNYNGLHLEFAGFASWTKKNWLKRRRALKRAAIRVARWSIKFNIPPLYISASGLQHGGKGITTHAQVSLAFHQSTHTDPGKGFPMGKFIRMVKREIKRMHRRSHR